MSTLIQGSQLRQIGLGTRVSKQIVVSGAATQGVFTVAGGRVLVTSLYGVVDTIITVAGTTKLVANPTLGTSVDLNTATDLGTTDTVAGEIIVPNKGGAITLGADDISGYPLIVAAGAIEQVTATGGDGAITWVATYVPLDDGATLVAA